MNAGAYAYHRFLRFAVFCAICMISPEAATAQVPPSDQTVRGQVVDSDAEIPLPGANIVVLNSDPLIGTTSDADGWFVLENVPLGRHDIQISFLGFESRILPQVLVTSGKEVVLRIKLKEQILESEELVVIAETRKDQALNDYALVGARSFSVEETRRYAGGLDDPARMASAFAGITTGGSIQENAMIIRGNAPKGVLWRLEGVEIPNPNHFAGLSVAGGGGVTLFSSQILGDSDFFTGAFPAEYGNALAGVFDMNFRTGNRASREHTFQAGLLGIEAASEGPFVHGRPSTYLFNYRYSTLGLLLPLLPTEDVAKYQDLSIKLSFPTPRLGRIEVWGIGGLDRQTMSAADDSSEWEYQTWDRLDSELELDIGAAGISHDIILGRTSHLHSTVAATVNRTLLDQRRIGDDLVLRDDLLIHATNERFILSSYLNHKFNARHTNRSGFILQRLFYDLNVAAALDHDSLPSSVARGSGGSSLVQLYSQSQFDLSSRLSLSAGVHVQHFALTGHTSLEPRIGLRRQLPGGQAISIGYGLHSQIEDLRIYFARPPTTGGSALPNRTLELARAHHAVLGYDKSLGAAARLNLEIYYQRLFDVPVIPDSSYSLINFEQDFTFDERLMNEGAGENYGIDLTLERFLQDGYYFLLTGSIFRSRYRGGDDIWRRTRFDRGYSANALFGREITLGGDDLLGLNGRLIFMGGRRRSPVNMPSSLMKEEVVYDEHRAFEQREPDLFLVDLTLTYRRNHTRISEVWALQVKNLLAAKNVMMDYNYATKTVDEVEEGFPLPVLSYKIEF